MSILSLLWSVGENLDLARTDPLFIHPSLELREAIASIAETDDDDGPDVLNRMKAAVQKAPLEEEPFVLAALINHEERRYAQAEQLIEIARTRNPRSTRALALSFDVTLALGQVQEAVTELEVLSRMAPSQSRVWQETVAALASHPEVGITTLKTLRHEPTKLQVLTAIARSGASVPTILDAARAADAAKSFAQEPTLVSAITQPLLRSGDFPGAYRVWSALVENAPGPSMLIRDGEFRGSLPPPFGWELRSGRDGFVSSTTNGLAGQGYGRRPMLLARQLLLLPQGNFELEVAVLDASDQMEIGLKCWSSSELARLRLKRKGRDSVNFLVPDQCDAQWLELWTRTSDPPRSSEFLIQNVAILEGDL